MEAVAAAIAVSAAPTMLLYYSICITRGNSDVSHTVCMYACMHGVAVP